MGKRANAEGTIYQRKSDKRWVAAVVISGVGRRAFYGRTRADAAEKLRVAQNAAASGTPIPSERLTVGRFLEGWLETTAHPGLRPRTYTSYELIVRRHIIPAIGQVRLARLTPAHVQTYMAAKRAQSLSPRTVQYHHSVLRRALGDAERWGMTPRNVARLVTPPRVERAEVRPLTPEQARAFLECCDRHQHQPLFVLAMATGLRQSELLGLSWPDVDLGAAAITVRAGLHRHDRGYIRTEPKTAASRRRLDLPAQAVAALHARLAQQKTDRLRVGPSWIGNPWDLVFTTEFGEPLSGFGVTRAFKRLLHEAGLPDQRFHDLRHGTATYLLVQGVPLKVVQTMLGHSTIHVTADTYAHVLPSLARDAADKVGELLWGAS